MLRDTRFPSRYQVRRQAWYDGLHAGRIAFDSERNEDVLLQFPYRPGDHASFTARADAFSRLSHPCIAPLLDRGVADDGLPFYAQPADVAGAGGGWVLPEKASSLGLRERVRIVMEVSDAIRSVHEAGFLHLQLTPRAIGLARERQVFVWGQVRYSPPVFIATRLVFDRPDGYYGAPEQIEIYDSSPEPYGAYPADAFDARWDVYALGGLLYTLIHWPAEQRSPALGPKRTIQESIAEPRDSSRLTAEDERLAMELHPVWRSALEVDPANRPASAAAFTQALQQALSRSA